MSHKYVQDFFHVVIAKHAKETPCRTFMSISRTTDMKDGFQDILYGRLSKSWIAVLSGSKGLSSLPACLPRHDLCGILSILAAAKIGRQIRPFGETDYILQALTGMDCDTFLKPDPCPKAVENVLIQRPMRTFDLPHIEAWLSPHHHPDASPYPYDLPEDTIQAAYQPISIFQISSLTTAPKPIVVRPGSASKHGTYQQLLELGQQPWFCAHITDHRVLFAFSDYQYAGLIFHVTCAVYFDYIIVTAPKVYDWSAETMAAATEIYSRVLYTLSVEFRPHVAVNRAYHLVVVRQKKLEDWQPASNNFPELAEYEMGDLFERHGKGADLWLFVGLIVELFILPDGRVLNAAPIKTDIAENPAMLLAMKKTFALHYGRLEEQFGEPTLSNPHVPASQ
ncbi:hypothetical protein M406DRAFT_76169 [Cryphonectria parasitica EP155]|uniref:Uncharacterized protein n=1 Tax=Cryphonectria parasitica (strain ATCC 38755 / EP155) TaxID=660469 RepID=A0A9P5CPY7_CRYP1|nr:uncharacterized protein M406DRAFT_76169 [Cryphonectria parasitica EP155]KAF3766653.1 hypothetical protein M406DRAFT_76169 [Cryphonectria parasitica EP155]